MAQHGGGTTGGVVGGEADAAWLRGMIAGLNAVVWERDPVTWGIRYVNDRVEELLGYPVAQWLDDPGLWFRILHPEDRDRIVTAVERALAVEQDFALSYRVRAADGRTVWLRHLGHIPRDEGGRPLAGHAVLIDVTGEQRREHAAALLAEAGRLLAGPQPVEQRLAAVAGLAVGELGERATVWLCTDDGRLRAVAAAPEEAAPELLALEPVAAPPSLVGAYRAGQPFVVPEVTGDMQRAAVDCEERRLAAVAELAPRSVLIAPLLSAGSLVGLLTLSSGAGRGYDDADVRLAGDLGQRIATTVDTERLAARQRSAHAITVALAAAGTVAEAAARVAEGLREGLDAALVTVCTVARDGLLHVEHVAGPPGRAAEVFPPMPLGAPLPLTEAVRTGRPVWVPDRAAWGERYPSAGAELLGETEAAAVLPLTAAGRVLGAVGLTFRTPRDFDDAERSFLVALAGQAAVAFERAALADLRQEIAETLQHSLLPRGLPRLDRLAVTARYLPGERGTAAGGDWYDVLPLHDGRVALAVGDVVGSGAAAAAVMGQLRSALATLLLEGHPPARALELLDRFADTVEGARVSTAACLLLDPATGRLTWSRAGHPPPLVVGGAGERYLDGAAGPALALPGARRARPEATVELEPGATLLLCTDGLVERRAETIDEGLARLAGSAAGLRGLLPGALVDGVLAALLDGGGPADDVAVVAARLVPGPLRLDLPADPAELRTVRRAVHGWARDAALDADVAEDLLLALGEAVANAVEHAYPAGRPGRVGVEVRADGSGLLVSVADAGEWRPPPADPGSRGRGLQIIRRLGEEVSVDGGPAGTTVRFRVRPAAPRGPLRPVEGEPAEGRPAALRVADAEGGRCLQLLGDLDLAGAGAVRGALLAALAEGPAVLDLTGVGVLSSAGMGLLVEAVALPGRPAAVLLPPDGPARRALDLTGLTPLLSAG